MSTTSTVTVNAIERTYEPQWHDKYATELGKGNASVEVYEDESSNLESIIFRTHSVSKQGIEKHYESIEDIVRDVTTGAEDNVKVGITITFRSSSPAARLRAEQLAAGHNAELSNLAELQSISRGKLQR